MPILSRERKAEHIEKMYEIMQTKNARATFKYIARRLKVYCKTASRTYKEALTGEKLFPVMLRPKICTDYKEYIYIINTKDNTTLFDKLMKKPHIEYMACCQGQFDLLIISRERIDLTMEDEFRSIFLSGERSDYIYPSTTRGDYEIVLQRINEFLNRREFIQSKIAMGLGERGNEWTDREEQLFRYLKQNARRKFTTIERHLGINRTALLLSYTKVRKHTVVTVPYYPKGFNQYMKFYVLIRTEYEKQAIDLLGSFPCHSAFFKVKDYLIGYISIEKIFTYEFLCIMSKMTSTGFAEDIVYSVPIFFYTRD